MPNFDKVFTEALFDAIKITNATRAAASKLPLSDSDLKTALTAVVQSQLNDIP